MAGNGQEEDALTIQPEVNPAAEFLEICNDFTEPREVVREAISNAFDAGSTVLKISAYVDKSSGVDELVLDFRDNGHGMDLEALKAFFGLGFSTRREYNKRGYKASSAIGEKGHGTKIYFNSRRVEVSTVKTGKCLKAVMDEPRKKLRAGELPHVGYEVADTDTEDGTAVRVIGYNENSQKGFSHNALRDYIYWFTKFGSFELELGVKTFENVVLHLEGLGRKCSEPEQLSFGHLFPAENTDTRSLKKSDKVSPLDYYVAKWRFSNVPVEGKPDSTIDVVFAIEGDQAKRKYNPMIHERYKPWQGEYNVEDRYGLWVAKDYIPIARRNEWIAERSEWTKYHAFVNSQDFWLTANRSSVDNTPAFDLDCIRKTVEHLFKERIVPDSRFQNYRVELERQQLYRNAEAEEKDFERRKKAAMQQKATHYKDIVLIEPRQEGGLFGLVMQILAVDPDIFGFKVVDYDTGFGYDLLVTKDYALDLNRASLRFVEMKKDLCREFSHSFQKLAAIICWNTKLSNDDKVTDLCGKERTMKITSPDPDGSLVYTKYMLVSDTDDHNVEVFVLNDFLREKLGLEFRPRSRED